LLSLAVAECPAYEEDEMSKARDAKKTEKKAATKTPKEKKAAKKEKKEASKRQ